MLWKLDGVTADGRRLEPDVMTAHGRPSWLSSFVFPQEEPSVRNWVAWRAFWSSQLRRDGTLERPLGVWTHPTHQAWLWHAANDGRLLYTGGDRPIAYSRAPASRSTRQQALFQRDGPVGPEVRAVAPVSVSAKGDHAKLVGGQGPCLCNARPPDQDFWTFLASWGGEWMWEVVNGESDDLLWLAEALCQGTSIWTTDGSYDWKRAPRVSGAGWIVCNKATRKVLQGNFYEVSRSASSYRGELLGLLALHTLALTVVEFYGIEQAIGVIRCDNDPALAKSKSNRWKVRSGASQADVLRALRSIKNKSVPLVYL